MNADNSKTPHASNRPNANFSQALDYSRENFHPKDSPRLNGMSSEVKIEGRDGVGFISERSDDEESK